MRCGMKWTRHWMHVYVIDAFWRHKPNVKGPLVWAPAAAGDSRLSHDLSRVGDKYSLSYSALHQSSFSGRRLALHTFNGYKAFKFIATLTSTFTWIKFQALITSSLSGTIWFLRYVRHECRWAWWGRSKGTVRNWESVDTVMNKRQGLKWGRVEQSTEREQQKKPFSLGVLSLDLLGGRNCDGTHSKALNAALLRTLKPTMSVGTEHVRRMMSKELCRSILIGWT